MVITGIALRGPDKTGHFRTLGQKALKTDEVATTLTARREEREGGRKEDLLRGGCLVCPVGGAMEIDVSPVGTGG